MVVHHIQVSSSALNFDYRAESACVYSRTFNRGSSSALNFDYRAESACLLTYLQQRTSGDIVHINWSGLWSCSYHHIVADSDHNFIGIDQ
ncbi:hypothetical protein ROHU_034557 [Labeo rohita]|uniref:Uncharacterized protein n=1 Tax=Labeo rohita TaxID=84645 RepID=A0A498L6U3_LABRO|nr:hypothetical protein ROHU_034557 [Labeo rohita]